MHHELEGAVRTIQRVVRSTVPSSVSGDEALSLVALLGEAERAVDSGIALFAPRVINTGSFTKRGYATAPDWLGAVSGSPAGTAKGRLVAAERAAESPELAEAVRRGDLSAAQLKIVTDTAAVAPQAAATLLPLIKGGASHRELSAAASRKRAEARSAECDRARRARVHASQHFRWHQDEDGGIRGEFLCDEVAWARVCPRLEADAKARWKAAGAAGGQSFDSHRLDAFIDLMAGTRAGPDRAGARDRAVVIIDAKALKRGTAKGDELCEIEGIGPVSVEAAAELISAAGLQFVVKDGVDIATVTGTTRAVRDRINIALLVRDRACVVPGCGKRFGIERDHSMIDFVKDGPTELANLARLCAPHHDMKTNGGWMLGGGPGRWTWDPPLKPPSKGRLDRERKVASEKAKARARRNKPLRN
jgi:hypothetical protein